MSTCTSDSQNSQPLLLSPLKNCALPFDEARIWTMSLTYFLYLLVNSFSARSQGLAHVNHAAVVKTRPTGLNLDPVLRNQANWHRSKRAPAALRKTPPTPLLPTPPSTATRGSRDSPTAWLAICLEAVIRAMSSPCQVGSMAKGR